MYRNILQDLGLSLNESKIYEALFTYGGSSVSTISLRAKVHRRNAYDSLNRLIEKGLVYRVFGETGDTLYEAVDPGKLMELLEEKERTLSASLPEMIAKYQSHRVPQRAYIYKGIEGVKNYLREILKIGEDIYSFAGKGFWFDPRLEEFVTWFDKQRRSKKMTHNHIWDAAVKESPPGPLGGEGHYRFLPEQYNTDSTLDIFGDHVVTFSGVSPGTIEDDVTIFVIVSPRLADSYRTWWKFMWDTLPEVKRKGS